MFALSVIGHKRIFFCVVRRSVSMSERRPGDAGWLQVAVHLFNVSKGSKVKSEPLISTLKGTLSQVPTRVCEGLGLSHRVLGCSLTDILSPL